MIFTVIWNKSAQSELAEIWLRAADQQAVADASDAIEIRLRRNGDTAGAEFFGHRLFVVEPLAVTFDVSPDDCMIIVLQVERID